MSKIDEISLAIIGLIGAGAILRCIYLGIKIISEPDEKDSYIKKLKHAFTAFILAISAFSILEIAKHYYG